MTLYEDLKWRGLIQDISDEKLIDKLNNEKLTFYIGTDPTADSMHIGHYSSFLISKRLAKAGHHPILLVGGATGLIGDPKPTAERPMISKEEVEHLLLFNHFPNPLFVLNTVGILYLNNNKYGIIILISTYLSSIILGILVRNKNTLTNNNCITKSSKSQTFTEIFSSSIKKSINSLLMISVTVCLFLILSTLIINIFHLNSYLSLGIKSILEMTMGLEHLSKLNISNIFKVILSSSIISFGGLSIHMQVISILDERIRYRNYFIGRIYQVLISLIISLILFYVI